MSVSADAGKVMLGVSGCTLIGHDGKVVMADDYYPASVSFYVGSARFRRAVDSSGDSGTPTASDCASTIASEKWEIGTSPASPIAVREVSLYSSPPGFGVYINVTQWVAAIAWSATTAGATIPWARIKQAAVIIRVSRVNTDTAGSVQVPLNISYTTDPTEWPATGTVSTPWSGAAWELLDSFTPPSNGAAGEILLEKTLTLDVAGSAPPLLLALYHTLPYDTSSFAAVGVRHPPISPISKANLIYNLA